MSSVVVPDWSDIVPVSRVHDACEAVIGARPEWLSPDAVLACLPGVHLAVPSEASEWRLVAQLAGAMGETIIVVTNPSLRRGGGFRLPRAEFTRFVSEHPARWAALCGQQDVMIVDERGAALWLNHHKGGSVLVAP